MSVEEVRWRALGAMRFVDATTGLHIAEPLLVEGAGIRAVRNRSGVYVVTDPPTTLLSQGDDVPFTVHDPRGRYMARLVIVHLAYDPEPDPVDVPLFPTPMARVAAGWAVLRASVVAESSGTPLAGALIRALRATDQVCLARGLTDERGEALVPVPGIPIIVVNSSKATISGNVIDVTLETIYDPTAGPIPNPDDLENRRATLCRGAKAATLAAGELQVQHLTVAVV